ncbi:putative amino-acid dehydratase [Candidatus Burkholderia verschuerenii]|uniref:Putative amino-acid dehydratase n=1 Tax=Candidatus Burkholderia verschuerenii TaxID=242163 RepID=A0A0L0MGZ2_9BURK|nr:threonine/serine dehydratase [Candidatus Burkholderia verschuerenii]KND61578.1 putative amino-acid dehydratase [Candidatus Burkholderia verschuerenii]
MSTTDLTIDGTPIPTLDDIAEQHMALTPWVARTPTFEKHDFPTLDGTPVTFKFELLQVSGTFKARGAFSNILALTDSERGAGVTCVSGGNHAVAVAYATQRMDVGAKVIIVKTASPARIEQCRRFGAEVVLTDNLVDAFDTVRRVEAEEGRVFIHPFNGYRTVLDTATLGYEWTSQAPDLDAVIVPIGGGGLAAGVSTAMRLANPSIHIYGVEPAGAAAMSQSFAANHTIKLDTMHSIADSLMAPHTEQYSYELCRRHIDEIVTVSDDELRNGMRLLFSEMKLAVEPACAAATAALLGPLRERLQGKRVGVLLCGTNTDAATFARHLGLAQ